MLQLLQLCVKLSLLARSVRVPVLAQSIFLAFVQNKTIIRGLTHLYISNKYFSLHWATAAPVFPHLNINILSLLVLKKHNWDFGILNCA